MGDHSRGHEAGERLYLPGDTLVHRTPAHVKLCSAFLTILLVVVTPGRLSWAFAGYAAVVAAVAVAARLPFRTLAARMAIEVPFVAFAVMMPFLGPPPTVALGPLELSEAGLQAGWILIVKATLGVAVSIILGATTTTSAMVAGLRRLRLPDVMVQILASMLRYTHVVGGEAHRMARAREARGFAARGPRGWPVLARSLGALFIRSYERGERVHRAMLSRGYTGRMPQLHPEPAPSARTWAVAAVPPGAAGAVLIGAVLAAGGGL